MGRFPLMKATCILIAFSFVWGFSEVQADCTDGRECPRCRTQLLGIQEIQACVEQTDGTRQCGCVPKCANAQTQCSAATALLCSLRNQVARCEVVETEHRGMGCVCTSKCKTATDCKTIDPTCNTGNSVQTCSNGACSCATKQCSSNTQCTGTCEPGFKPFCKNTDWKCACVPNDYCDADADCGSCQDSYKRYCGKYDVPGEFTPFAIKAHRCECIGTDQCQQNGDCGVGKCCVSDKGYREDTYPYKRFGACETYAWIPIRGCIHSNTDGIEARPTPSTGGGL